MTFALFDDGGKFHAGRILSETDASAQIELDSGKRVKVKAANLLLRFEAPAPVVLLGQAEGLVPDIDLDLAWEFAPEEEFGFADFARDYFDAGATAVQQAAVLLRLFGAPHYFRRAGKGRFKKAPEEIVKAALLAIERKQQQQAQVDDWAQALASGQCPDPVRRELYKILFKPDKNSLEYKAVVQATRSAQLSPLELFKRAGAIDSPYQFHWHRFLFEQFPTGTDFPKIDAPAITEDLPVAPVQAFSIDDSGTTEIDDALSVQGLGSGTVTLGVHIAAPGLAVAPGSSLDQVARSRLSTVYMPGWKLTMLPDEVVQRYTLLEGQNCPALSLYVSFDEQTLAVKESETRLEQVPVALNMRYDLLDDRINAETLTGQAPADYAFAPQLAFLFRLAQHLKAQREIVRGKPENFSRPDYNFRLVGNGSHEPTGDETVEINVRQRGAPLDLIVAEAMIVANSTWGGWLARLGVPGIYRSQASMAPGVKVRMGTKALPHAGIGVPQYAWSTSPLRRYTDLVNQWQIIACARHGAAAALAAPFKPKDADLYSVISAFDAAYTAYNDFQRSIERFWALRYLQQHDITEIDAAVLKEGLVRTDGVPLVFRAVGAETLPRNTRVRVRIGAIDTLTLDVSATVDQVLQPDDAAETAKGPDAGDDATEDAEDDAASGPIALAVDMDDDAEKTEVAADASGTTVQEAGPTSR